MKGLGRCPGQALVKERIQYIRRVAVLFLCFMTARPRNRSVVFRPYRIKVDGLVKELDKLGHARSLMRQNFQTVQRFQSPFPKIAPGDTVVLRHEAPQRQAIVTRPLTACVLFIGASCKETLGEDGNRGQRLLRFGQLVQRFRIVGLQERRGEVDQIVAVSFLKCSDQVACKGQGEGFAGPDRLYNHIGGMTELAKQNGPGNAKIERRSLL